MKSSFKEVFIYADSLTVDLSDILKVSSGEIKIAYILHDKSAVFPHYHIFLDFGNNKVDDMFVMKLFNVCNRLVCTCRGKNWIEIKTYMLHTRDNEYSADEIVSNFDLSNY